ncbi:MAG: PadR family transcriptional regulator [Gammaproteobacteria bacterium]|nr:PadR family transcriptional regulator [Gammaproteobacteria bacterium]
MSLRQILLGMLAKPASGYDLKHRFDQSLRHFWAADLAQIYPALKKLRQDELLDQSMEPSAKGPPRRVYRRNRKGKKAVREWLLQGPEFRNDRISYLAQVYFLADLDDPAEVLSYMHSLRKKLAEQLATLRDIDKRWRADDPKYPDELDDAAFYPQLTLQFGLDRLATTLDWCDHSIARIRRRIGE